jgi:di/tricarboxylate transporter
VELSIVLLFSFFSTSRLCGHFFQVLLMFGAVIGVVTSFISHTVGAMVLLPVVQSIGEEMSHRTGTDHSHLLIMGAALMCSGGMALPVSGFPNMQACFMQDQTGRPYVTAKDFLKTGVFGTIVTWLVVGSIGFPLMVLVGM